MALIGTIRKQSGLLLIVVGVALAAFVLGDFLKPRSGKTAINIAEIYGEDINYTEFDAKYEQNLEIQKRNQNKENLTSDEVFQLKQQTWDQIIQQIVLDKEYEELGLVVTAEELFDQLQGEEPHSYILQYFKDPETDQYDPEMVRNYIKNLDQMDANSRNQWEVFVQAIREDREKTKYKNLISKGWFMPDTFVVADFNRKKTNAKIRLVGARYNTIQDSLVNLTDEDYNKYYEDYKQNYKQEASRDLDYVVLDVKPSPEDRKSLRDEVGLIYQDFEKTENAPLFVNAESDNKYDSTFYKEGELPVRMDSILFNSSIGTYIEPYVENNAWHMANLVDIQFRPDSMKASHILISYSGNQFAGENVTRIKVDAKALADSLVEVVKSSPNKLESLAKDLSDDPSVAENSGDMSWFADGTMVYPFNQAVLEGKVGDITFAETQFGYHVIKITGKQEPVKKVRVAIVDIAITPSQQTYQNTYAQASEFQGKATSLEAFDTLAASKGLNIRNATYLNELSNRIAGIDYPRSIIQWSFIEGIGVGSVSPVFTMEDKYVVAVVKKTREEGIPELEELKETLEPLVIKEKKGDLMIEKMKDILNTEKDLSQIAIKLESKVDTLENVNFNMRGLGSYGKEANVIAKVFDIEKNVLSEPIKGNNAAFCIIVDEIKEPDGTEDKKMNERQLLMNFRSKISNESFIKSLEDKADIVDNRVKFF